MKCCCCIPVRGGAILLTTLSFLMSSMCLCILFPYLLKVDVETFNPMEKGIEALKKFLPAKFKEYEVIIDTNELKDNVDKYGWSFFIVLTIAQCLSTLFNLLALGGHVCKKSKMIIPDLIMQLVNLVIFFIPLAGLCVVLGFVHPLGCGLMSGFTILVGALMTYFWVVLFRGYQQISKSHEIEEVEDYDTFAEEMTHRF